MISPPKKNKTTWRWSYLRKSEKRSKVGLAEAHVSQRTSHVAQSIGNLKQIVAVDCSSATGLKIQPIDLTMRTCSVAALYLRRVGVGLRMVTGGQNYMGYGISARDRYHVHR